MVQKLRNPTHSEVEILQSLWNRRIATVRDVHGDISEFRKVGYTTTLKQMQNLEADGLIEKVSTESRAHTYKAVQKPEKVRKVLMRRLLDSAFAKSESALIVTAISEAKMSAEEIAEIRDCLDSLKPLDE